MYRILLATNMPIIEKGLYALAADAIPEDFEIRMETSFSGLENRPVSDDIGMLVLDLDMVTDKTPGWPRKIGDLLKLLPSLRTIVLYEKVDHPLFRKLYAMGVTGMIGKSASLANMRACLQQAHKGEIYVDNEILVAFIKGEAKSNRPGLDATARLSEKERMVATLLMEGKNNKQIGRLLQLQPSTVSTFKHHVFKKLHVNNLLELASLPYTLIMK